MEKQTAKAPILRFLAGLFIGIAAIAPGISGGAICVIFGLYQPITDALAYIWKDFWAKVKFFWPMAVGASVGMLLFGHLINYLFVSYRDYTCALFVGLLLGTLPSVFKSAAKEGFHLRYLWATFVFGALVVWITALKQIQYVGAVDQLPWWLMLVCGGILGFGSILPGVSASFVLISLGLYESILQTLNTLNIPNLLLLGAGFCGAVLLLTRLVNFLFKKAYGWISFATAGMIIGSIVNVVPTMTADLHGAALVLLALFGGFISFFSLKIAK